MTLSRVFLGRSLASRQLQELLHGDDCTADVGDSFGGVLEVRLELGDLLHASAVLGFERLDLLVDLLGSDDAAHGRDSPQKTHAP